MVHHRKRRRHLRRQPGHPPPTPLARPRAPRLLDRQRLRVGPLARRAHGHVAAPPPPLSRRQEQRLHLQRRGPRPAEPQAREQQRRQLQEHRAHRRRPARRVGDDDGVQGPARRLRRRRQQQRRGAGGAAVEGHFQEHAGHGDDRVSEVSWRRRARSGCWKTGSLLFCEGSSCFSFVLSSGYIPLRSCTHV